MFDMVTDSFYRVIKNNLLKLPLVRVRNFVITTFLLLMMKNSLFATGMSPSNTSSDALINAQNQAAMAALQINAQNSAALDLHHQTITNNMLEAQAAAAAPSMPASKSGPPPPSGPVRGALPPLTTAPMLAAANSSTQSLQPSQAQISQQLASAMSDLNSAQHAFEAKNNVLQQNTQNLAKIKGQLDAYQAVYDDALNILAQTETAKEDAKTKLRSATDTVKEMQKNIKTITAKQTSEEKKIAANQKKIDKDKQTIEKNTTQIETLKTSLENHHADSFESQLSDLNSQLQTLQENLSEEKNAVSSETGSDKTNTQHQIKETQTQIKALQKQISGVTKQHNNEKKKINATHNKIELLKSKNEALQHQINQKTSENETLTQSLQTLAKQLEDSQEQLTKAAKTEQEETFAFDQAKQTYEIQNTQAKEAKKNRDGLSNSYKSVLQSYSAANLDAHLAQLQLQNCQQNVQTLQSQASGNNNTQNPPAMVGTVPVNTNITSVTQPMAPMMMPPALSSQPSYSPQQMAPMMMPPALSSQPLYQPSQVVTTPPVMYPQQPVMSSPPLPPLGIAQNG